MVDTCEVRRASIEQVTDPATGEVTDTPGELVYAGACQVQVTSTAPEQNDAADVRYHLLPVVVSVPIDETRYEQGDVVTITASQLDPALAGRRYRVEAVLAKTYATARRLVCEEGVT